MTALSMECALPAAEVGQAGCSIVFLTGCGRSGTTILGTVLGQRSDVQYLNDRFELWTDASAITDIWADRAEPARVALTAEDVTPAMRTAVLRRLEVARGEGSLVIEKLAINNFRLDFLRAMAPRARFINIRRHGVEVARSIARKIEARQWYGGQDRKWRLLVEHARQRGLGDLADSCEAPYQRGLLEWRLSVEAAEPWVEELAPDSLIAVTYEEALADPAGTARRIEDFLGLAPDPAAGAWAEANLGRRHPAAGEAPIPACTERIAGDTLRRLGYTF